MGSSSKIVAIESHSLERMQNTTVVVKVVTGANLWI